VLEYDEVMNEQRKVIYKRRDQILDAADLRDEAMEYLAEAVDGVIGTFCVSDFHEEWDLPGLLAEMTAYWPVEATEADLDALSSTDELYDRLMAEATAYYESREAELGADTMREMERQIMLQIIDQRWREHLYEMDYLQEGINLRAMGQKDPLVEWQREGFEMFGAMMQAIAQDFVKYVMRAEVAVTEQMPSEAELRNVEYSAPTDPSEAGDTMAAAARVQAALEGAEAPDLVEPDEPIVNTPVVKTEWEKTGRNEPCPCGSGKKFKQCHGA
jgi:preprotein translocase subunit SecA